MEVERFVQDAAACVVAFVAFGKVLSPQYLLWLVPLVPLARGRRGLAATGLLAVALVLTQAWFPRRYWDYATGLDRDVAALVSGRDRLAGGLLGAAVAAKLYPAVLVPLVAVWIWRRRGRRELLVAAGIFCAVLAVCVVPFLLVAPDGLASSLWRQLDRPLQIESLPAALLVLAGSAEVESGHGSQNLAGNGGVALGIVMAVAAAAVLVWLWLRFPRGPMEPARLVRDAAACVVAFVALGKVLSPQILLWLVPLVPHVRGRRGL